MSVDLGKRKALLEEHLEQYWEMQLRKPNAATNFRPYVDRWRAMYSVLLRDERFLTLAQPVTSKTRLGVSQYYMRYDGVFCFLTAVLREPSGREIILANPLRFPYDPKASPRRPYLSQKYEYLFSLHLKTTTKVKNSHGRKDHACQIEEGWRIKFNQENSRNPIRGFYFHPEGLCNCPVFKRENFIFEFPIKPALHYMLFQRKFEPLVKGVKWLLEEAHRKPYAKLKPFELSELGATGSSSFGDEEDKEDFDVVYFGTVERLRSIRNFIRDGMHYGTFDPIYPSQKRKPRVYNNEVIVELINQRLLMCPFFVLDDHVYDPLDHARIVPIERLHWLKATVVDDSGNMLTPSYVKVIEMGGYLWNTYGLNGPVPLILMHGFRRGDFYRRDRLIIKKPFVARIHPVYGDPFIALICTAWFDVETI